MDGAHTHGHGPTGLGELVARPRCSLAADILARVRLSLLVVWPSAAACWWPG
jgi:hypothetical protein